MCRQRGIKAGLPAAAHRQAAPTDWRFGGVSAAFKKRNEFEQLSVQRRTPFATPRPGNSQLTTLAYLSSRYPAKKSRKASRKIKRPSNP